jgi:hypothetical protein
MIESREQAPESQTTRREPAFSGFAVAMFVLSEVVCLALVALVFF